MKILPSTFSIIKTKIMEVKTVVTHSFTENVHENTCFKPDSQVEIKQRETF